MNASRRGFTLVEVLAATAISGALMLGLFAALDMLARYRTAGRDQAQCDRIANAVAQYLECSIRETPLSIKGDLDSVYAPKAKQPPRQMTLDTERIDDPLLVTGDETTLIVAARDAESSLPQQSASRVARLITGESIRAHELPGLWRRRSVEAASFSQHHGGYLSTLQLREIEPATTIAASRWQAGLPILLSDAVTDIKFRYFDGLTWLPRWDGDGRKRLQAVEVSFVARSGSVTRPVRLVIATVTHRGLR